MQVRTILRRAGVGRFLLNYVFTPAQKISELKYPDSDVSIKVGHHTLQVFSPRKNRIGRALYTDRIWEPEVTEVIEQNTKAGMTALDIGADIGYYTLNLARLVGPKGSVVAFEPIPKARERLRHNISANGYENILISEYALGNQEGVVYLEDPFNASRISLTKDEGGARDIKVDIKRLDDLIGELGIDKVDIIKMDIEGAEHEALRGMEKTLLKHKPILVIEVHHKFLPFFNSTSDAVRKWLTDLGYQIATIDEAMVDEGHAAHTVYCRFNA